VEKGSQVTEHTTLAKEVYSQKHSRLVDPTSRGEVMRKGTASPLHARELKRRADLVSFVRHFTRLRRAGCQFVGLCPLHNEKNPSFFVHPKKQTFYCFGCGIGGDIFAFAMTIRGCGFRSALGLVNDFLLGVAFASDPRSGSRFGESEGGGSPLSPPKAGVLHSQSSPEDARAIIIARLDATNRRLEAIRKANREAAEILATACEPSTDSEGSLLLESQR
jgi:CHC2 zinc finger